jgi:hypothetical protein
MPIVCSIRDNCTFQELYRYFQELRIWVNGKMATSVFSKRDRMSKPQRGHVLMSSKEASDQSFGEHPIWGGLCRECSRGTSQQPELSDLPHASELAPGGQENDEE